MPKPLLTEPIRLDPKTVKELEDMSLNITLLKSEIAKAKRAGLDMSEMEEKLNQTIRLREGLLREYR